MAKPKTNFSDNVKRNEVDELPFWEGKLIKIKQAYAQDPSEGNRIWVENVQFRIRRLQDLLQNSSKQQVEKPKFKEGGKS